MQKRLIRKYMARVFFRLRVRLNQRLGQYALVTAVPCVFITLTTFAAGLMNIRLYLAKGMMLNTVLSIVVIAFVSIVIVDNVRVWRKLLATDKPLGMNDERGKIFCPVVAPHPPDDLPLA